MASKLWKLHSLPAWVTFYTALVRIPRAVPAYVLHYTVPEGLHPFVLHLPSRLPKRKIPVYVFAPPNLDRPSKDGDLMRPVILDFHGGGFIMGSCLEQGPFCALLSRELQAVVISVDYRMGPIDQFPAAYEDAEEVLSAVLNEESASGVVLRQGITSHAKKAAMGISLDTKRVAVAGFSSGGNVALNLALSVSESTPEVSAAWPSRFAAEHPASIPLLLFYPSLDCRKLPSERTRPAKMPPMNSYMKGRGDTLMSTYLPRVKAEHPRASPGLVSVKESLHEKARMLLILPELDTLAEQSEAWVEKVRREGRGENLKVMRYEGMKHGWTQFPVSWLGEEERRVRLEAFEAAVSFVRESWDAESR